MERLTKREKVQLSHGEEVIICQHDNADCNDSCMKIRHCNWYRKAMEKLWDYENKQEQGLQNELPCKVGDTVYFLSYTEIYECNVKEIIITKSGIRFSTWCEKWRIRLSIYLESFGKNVFLTRSEAEKALAKMGGNDHEQNYQGNT